MPYDTEILGCNCDYDKQCSANFFTFCYGDERYLTEKINYELEAIESGNKQFSFIDFNLTIAENLALQKIYIHNTLKVPFSLDNPNNYCNMLDLVTFFMTQDQDSENASIITNLIFRVAKSVINSSGYEHALIELRTYITKSWYFPDWHVDKSLEEIAGSVSIDNSHDQIYLFTLKGKTTLFQESNCVLRAQFHQLASSSRFSYGYSQDLPFHAGHGIDRLFNISDAASPNIGELSLHMAGYQYGAVHSGPAQDEGEQRLVVIVKPGNKE